MEHDHNFFLPLMKNSFLSIGATHTTSLNDSDTQWIEIEIYNGDRSHYINKIMLVLLTVSLH